MITECQRGVYEGLRGEVCLHCEDNHPGANCTDSHIQTYDAITSLDGWWRYNRSVTSDQCHPLR